MMGRALRTSSRAPASLVKVVAPVKYIAMKEVIPRMSRVVPAASTGDMGSSKSEATAHDGTHYADW